MAKDIAAIINKELGFNAVKKGLTKADKVKFIKTGLPMLDWALGGGLPVGRLTEVYGHESVGKSLVMLYAASRSLQRGKTVAWFDLEGAMDPDFIDRLGLVLTNHENLFMYERNDERPFGENVYQVLFKLLDMGKKNTKSRLSELKPMNLIIIDSVATIVSRSEFEKNMEAQSVGRAALLNNQGVKIAMAKNKNSAVVMINQLRTSMSIGRGGRPAQDQPGGGKMIKFAASLRVRFRRVEQLTFANCPEYLSIKRTDRRAVIGQRVAFKVEKSKVGEPLREGTFDFYFDTGIDIVDQNFNGWLMSGKIIKAGQMYTYNEKQYRGKPTLLKQIASELK